MQVPHDGYENANAHQNQLYGELYDLVVDPGELANRRNDPSQAGVKCDLLTERQGRLPLRLAPNQARLRRREIA